MESNEQINNEGAYTNNIGVQFMENRTIRWTTEETQFLVEMYKKNCNNIGPHKMFRSKLHLWNEIKMRLNKAFELQRTTIQCIGCYKSMQKKTKNTNQPSELSNKVFDASEMSSSEDEPPQENLSTIAGIIRSTLLEIHQLKEEAKERRHRERMQLLEQILRGDTGNLNINLHIEPENEPEAEMEPEPELELEPEPEPEPIISFQSIGKSVQPLPVMQRQVESRMQLTRERLLQMQRKKMEDRERKHKMLKIEQ